jgi:excisionase family DNA binding protein
MDDDLLDSIFADLPDLLLRSEAAAILRCRDQHISDLVRQRELSAYQRRKAQGSKVLIYKASLRAYIERHSR